MIVIFAREDDRHALAVADCLAREHDEDSTIIDLSGFPSATRLMAAFSAEATSCVYSDARRGPIDLFEAKSFWWRRPQSLVPDSRVADPLAQHFALNESLSALYGLLRCCPGFWVNDIDCDQSADFKPRQLAAARRHGLRVPETLITNDPAAVRAFWDRTGGDLVFKAFNQRGIIWRPTRRLAAADLERLEALACAPVIFQRYAPGDRDIRVTVVGQAVYAAEFRILDPGTVDHRHHLDTAPCVAHQLPPPIERQVLEYVRALGLEYGCVDLRLSDDGDYWFFEINTAGEFLYVQTRTGLRIDRAMAALLASGGRRQAAPLPAHAWPAPEPEAVS